MKHRPDPLSHRPYQLAICGVTVAVMAGLAWLSSVPSKAPVQAADVAPSTSESNSQESIRRMETLFREASRGEKVVTPSEAELRAVTGLFRRTLIQKEEFSALRVAWSEWNMTLTNIEEGRQSFWLLRENADSQSGRGIFAFRSATAIDLALQAPHSGFDQHTGEIVIRLFAEHPVRCAAWNTLPRKMIDLAHTGETYFQAFTRAIGESQPNLLVAQIHGFDERKRETKDGERASLILSNGTEKPADWFLKAATAFRQKLSDETVSLYPFDVRELGGTTNVQGRQLQQLGDRNFLHAECNRNLRQRLHTDQPARAEFMDCFRELLRIKSNRQ